MQQGVKLGVQGYVSYQLFGKRFWITTTHISILIVCLSLLCLAYLSGRVIRKANPRHVPSMLLNIIECIVQGLDRMTCSNMGKEQGMKFANYMGTLFLFLICSNLSGLFGLRPPTADYAITFCLAGISFFLIQITGIIQNGFGHWKSLFEPLPFLFPINFIGEIATPLSLSLRLFGNVMAGTVMLKLLYGLLPKWLLIGWPALLHAYFDLFSGLIQAYVFCMLTMIFIANQFQEKGE